MSDLPGTRQSPAADIGADLRVVLVNAGNWQLKAAAHYTPQKNAEDSAAQKNSAPQETPQNNATRLGSSLLSSVLL